MTISIEVLENKIREKGRILKETGIFCLPVYGKERSRPAGCQSFTVRSGPLPIEEGVSYFLAEQVAKEQKVHLTKYDFGRGEDEILVKYVFSVECDKEGQFEEAIEKIRKAHQELQSTLVNVAKVLRNK